MAIDPKTAIEWGAAIAKAALEVARTIKDSELRRESVAQARNMLSDQRVLLDLEIEEMLEDKYK